MKIRVRRLARAARRQVAAVMRKVPEWTDQLTDSVTEGHPIKSAVLEGIRAFLTGKNVVWAAFKGLLSGLSIKTKILLALAVVLVALLAPVLLVVALLVLLVAGVIAAIRAATQ
ncbi:hypothetical protein GQ85_21560 [Rhodococcus rhodochrous]|nr:hypothetical protein GQ85_21560 [Rhodococcus rhodochrous]